MYSHAIATQLISHHIYKNKLAQIALTSVCVCAFV